MDPQSSLRLVLAELASDLSGAGIDHATSEVDVLAAHVFGVSLSQLRTWAAMGKTLAEGAASAGLVTGAAIEDLREVVTRRAAREPLQYIVGSAPFRFLDLAVGPGVFIPRPETETVTQYALDWLRGEGTDPHGTRTPVVVDLCAGSGAIGLSIATELPGSRVEAVEISPSAFSWLRRNEEATRAVFPQMHYSAHLADAFSDATLSGVKGKVDCVISNPPYVPLASPPTQPEVGHDPDIALYGGSQDGLATPQRAVERAAQLLRPGGLVVVEHDETQGSGMRLSLIANGFSQTQTHPDLTGRPRFSSGVAAGSGNIARESREQSGSWGTMDTDER